MNSIFRLRIVMAKMLTILLIFSGTCLFAQVESGRDFRHLVKSKETYFSISRQYGISIEEIKRANPGVDYPKAGAYLVIPGVKSSQDNPVTEFELYTTLDDLSIYTLARILRYPIDSLKKWNPGMPSFLPKGIEVKTRPINPGIFEIVHKVIDERSSLRDLGQLYSVPYKTLKAYNPRVKNRLWSGQKVRIPILEEGTPSYDLISKTGIIPDKKDEDNGEKERWTDCRKDARYRNKTYKVALMVPFSLEQLSIIDSLVNDSPSDMMGLPSFRFIQFYYGFMMAANSLAGDGLKLELSVYDVDQDIFKARALLTKPDMRDMDLIVGPFYKNSFSIVAEFACKNEIPIINPLSAREDILDSYPNVFKVIPSRTSQINELAFLVDNRFYNYNIVVVKENKYQGNVYVEAVCNTLSEITHQEIQVVDYMTDSIAGVQQYLSESVPNLVIVYAEREMLPVEILPLLSEINKDVEVTVIGLPEWDNFEQLENKYLIDLGAYIFSESFIDYQEPFVKKFITKFRSQFLAEPQEYAYVGFDAGYFFLTALMDWGRDFPDCIAHSDTQQLLHTRYHFRKIPDGGYDNINWNIYHYQNYYLIQVPDLR